VIDVNTLDSGEPYIVMEYLEGTDLAKQLARRGPLPVAQAVAHVLQACEALAEAHAYGIVHRDLKLSNLFMASYPDGTPCIKILDFGISKYSLPGSDPDLSMTSTAAVMGSPLYMSPEQLRSSRNVDARSDIWALGVILYELVTGRVPFDGRTMPVLCTMVLQDEPPPLGPLVRDLPRGFEAVVLRCLVKDRTRRFQNVYELARALSDFAPPEARASLDRMVRLAAAAPPGSPLRGPATEMLEQSPFAATVHPRRRGWRAGALAFLAVALAVGVWRWLLPSGVGGAVSDPTPLPTPAPAPASTASADKSLPPPPSAPAPAIPAPAAPAPASTASAAQHRPKTKAAKPPGTRPPATEPSAPATPPAPPPVKPNPLDGRL
jgi:serine/threonine-protein kinase